MKTTLKTAIILCLTILSFVACNDDHEIVSPYTDIKFENLPENAQDFISIHFDGLEVISAKKRNTVEADGTLYKVSLADGFFIDFNTLGAWVTIGGSKQEIPNSIFTDAPLLAMKEYISANYKTDKIAAIQKKSYSEYQIDLLSGVQLTFDKDGSLIE